VIELAEDKAPLRLLIWNYAGAGGEALLAGRFDDAARWFHTALVRARETGYWSPEGFGIMGAQALLHARGELEASARLFGGLEPHLANLERGIPPEIFAAYVALVDALRDQLGS